MKGLIVLLICICLSGCSWFNPTANCKGDHCDQSTSFKDPGSKTTWYCYSTADTNKWNCQDESDPTKILSLKQVGLKQVTGRTLFANQSRKPRAPGPPHQRAKQASSPQQSVQPQRSVSPPARAAAIPSQQVASLTPPSRLAQRSSSPASAEANQGATSILQQPAGFYAVQLIALRDEQKILQYARDNGLKYPICAQIRSNGQMWYVLLLGVYPDRLSAAHAKDGWATNKNLAAKPWIRELGPLQDAIRLAVR